MLLSSLSAQVLRHVHDETEIKKDIKAINQVLRVRLDFIHSGGVRLLSLFLAHSS